jgi:hypothetical protein
VARRLLALLTILAALILFGTGGYLGGTPGIMAGGITALYLLKQQPGLETAILMTEGPATFWLATFALLISIYLRTHRRGFLFAAGLAFAGLCLTRSNFFPTLIFVSTLLLLRRTSLGSLIVFALIVIIPAVLWSLMATGTAGRLILLTTQGEIAFPQFNNMDVITGTELTRPGTWSPGFSLNEQGELYINGKNLAQPGENGWVKGLTFWRDHLDLLPSLFYVKLEANFWYNSGVPMGILRPERVYLSAIGFLLLVIGLRQTSPRRILTAVNSKHVFYGQLALVTLLVIVGNAVPLWIILLIWLFIGTNALLFPYDQAIWLKETIPVWVLCFVGSHFIVTLLYGEPRFSWPLDPILMLTGLLGLIGIFWAPIATRYGYS